MDVRALTGGQEVAGSNPVSPTSKGAGQSPNPQGNRTASERRGHRLVTEFSPGWEGRCRRNEKPSPLPGSPGQRQGLDEASRLPPGARRQHRRRRRSPGPRRRPVAEGVGGVRRPALGAATAVELVPAPRAVRGKLATTHRSQSYCNWSSHDATSTAPTPASARGEELVTGVNTSVSGSAGRLGAGRAGG